MVNKIWLHGIQSLPNKRIVETYYLHVHEMRGVTEIVKPDTPATKWNIPGFYITDDQTITYWNLQVNP